MEGTTAEKGVEATEITISIERPMMWEKSNNEPVAYTSHDRQWGMVYGEGGWVLHFLERGRSRRVVSSFGGSVDNPPFDDVNKEVSKIIARRGAMVWSEAMIGNRKPGDEGFNGGKQIPMQTEERNRRR